MCTWNPPDLADLYGDTVSEEEVVSTLWDEEGKYLEVLKDIPRDQLDKLTADPARTISRLNNLLGI